MDEPTFSIKSGSSDFLNKQKNIFDLLTLAEQGQELTRGKSNEEILEIDSEHSRKRKRKETKQFRGRESLFKEPQELPPRFRRHSQIPDYQRNPHRWKKYSLADVTQDDMSNASNTAAAFSFLKSVRSDKRTKVEKMDEDEGEHSSKQFKSSIKFNCPKKVQEKKVNFGDESEPVVDDQIQDKPVFKSSKLIMPEYVVGQPKKMSKKKGKLGSTDKGKQIRLDHIQDYEDE